MACQSAAVRLIEAGLTDIDRRANSGLHLVVDHHHHRELTVPAAVARSEQKPEQLPGASLNRAASERSIECATVLNPETRPQYLVAGPYYSVYLSWCSARPYPLSPGHFFALPSRSACCMMAGY